MKSSSAKFTVMLVGGPVIALITHELIYLTTYESCTRQRFIPAHVIAAAGAVMLAWLVVYTVNGFKQKTEPAEEVPTVHRARVRKQFMAAAGISVTCLSLLLLLSQWTSVFVLGSCATR